MNRWLTGKHLPWRIPPVVYFLLAGGLFLPGCGGCTGGQHTDVNPTAFKPVANSLELTFTYGSEKEKWVTEVTEAFNREQHKDKNGKPIFVHYFAMGSGDCTDEILSGRRQTDLTSPASAAFIELGNAWSRAKTGKDLVGPTQNLVLSPVVIAMWKPMAEAIGWGQKPVGWSDILALARDPQGWAAHGHPEWGTFKFGHTNPNYSNSGLISLFAEVYAGAGKVKGLTQADVQDPKVGKYLEDIEKAVVHYGSSTGFFGTKMFSNGPQYLSAAVLYENMVIDSYSPEYSLPFPVVAIYPKEGTFWSDHPIGIVDRPWVTDDQREAAKVYIQYLLDRPQQEKAIAYGFRPANVDVPSAAPLDSAHGIDPKEPKTTLEVPNALVMSAITDLWAEHKKHANIVLVFDTSGSMAGAKMNNARSGASQFITMLGDEDQLSLLPFSTQLRWADKGVKMKEGRGTVTKRVESLFADGETALYDAIDSGYQYLIDNPQPDKISAVVVLTDGEDTSSQLKLDGLLNKVRSDNERKSIRIFTIAYGTDADQKVLKSIADATQGKFFVGTPENIHEVFKEISSFF